MHKTTCQTFSSKKAFFEHINFWGNHSSSKLSETSWIPRWDIFVSFYPLYNLDKCNAMFKCFHNNSDNSKKKYFKLTSMPWNQYFFTLLFIQGRGWSTLIILKKVQRLHDNFEVLQSDFMTILRFYKATSWQFWGFTKRLHDNFEVLQSDFMTILRFNKASSWQFLGFTKRLENNLESCSRKISRIRRQVSLLITN